MIKNYIQGIALLLVFALTLSFAGCAIGPDGTDTAYTTAKTTVTTTTVSAADAAPEAYKIGGKSIPSVTKVIGDRPCSVGGSSLVSENAIEFVRYSYTSQSTTEDLKTYTQYLVDNEGAKMNSAFDGTATLGKIDISLPSGNQKNNLKMHITYDKLSYEILVELTPVPTTTTKK